MDDDVADADRGRSDEQRAEEQGEEARGAALCNAGGSGPREDGGPDDRGDPDRDDDDRGDPQDLQEGRIRRQGHRPEARTAHPQVGRGAEDAEDEEREQRPAGLLPVGQEQPRARQDRADEGQPREAAEAALRLGGGDRNARAPNGRRTAAGLGRRPDVPIVR